MDARNTLMCHAILWIFPWCDRMFGKDKDIPIILAEKLDYVKEVNAENDPTRFHASTNTGASIIATPAIV